MTKQSDALEQSGHAPDEPGAPGRGRRGGRGGRIEEGEENEEARPSDQLSEVHMLKTVAQKGQLAKAPHRKRAKESLEYIYETLFLRGVWE